MWTATETLLGLARALRAAGLPVTADRERSFLEAAALVCLDDRTGVYWAGRATMTADPADAPVYDQVFTAWFGGTAMHLAPRPRPPSSTTPQASLTPTADGDGGAEEPLSAAASATEVLRHRDVATLTAAERARVARLFATLRPRPPLRRARRHTPARTGTVDGRATLRAQLRRMGEPGPVHHRRRTTRPRRVVVLLDVSGSMAPYADSLLRLAHTLVRAAPRTTEVFTLGTRLTRVSVALRERDVERALAAAGEVVPDWSGGTRLGETLGAFLDRWGRRGTARQAVVVICSDGWERQGPELLAEQMRRLHGLAHTVVWANPHRGRPGYRPVQAGIVAALPYVDVFVPGHSLASFSELLEVVSRA